MALLSLLIAALPSVQLVVSLQTEEPTWHIQCWVVPTSNVPLGETEDECTESSECPRVKSA